MNQKPKTFKKPLVPFEEYYAVLKACVEDPEVISAVHRYFELRKKYYAEGGDPLSDCKEESDECYDAFNDIGFSIDRLGPEHWRGALDMGQSNVMDGYVIQFIWREWPKVLPYGIDINDKLAVKAGLKSDGRAQVDYGDDA